MTMLEIAKPTIATGSYFRDIDPEQLLWCLRQRGPIKAGGIDFDSTILPQDAMEPSEADVAVIRGFFELGVPLGGNSNAASKRRGQRVSAIAENVSERVGEELIAVSTYGLGGHWYDRKPSTRPFNVTARKLGVPNHEMFHIGDQGAKDVLGANLAGYAASVQVEPCAPEDDPLGVRLWQRPVETKLLERWRAPFGMDDQEGQEVVRVTADFYHDLEHACRTGAVVAAIAGLAEARRGKLGRSALLEACAIPILGASIIAGRHEKRQRVVEEMIDLALNR